MQLGVAQIHAPEARACDGPFNQEEIKFDRLPGLGRLFEQFRTYIQDTTSHFLGCQCDVELGEIRHERWKYSGDQGSDEIFRLIDFEPCTVRGAFVLTRSFLREASEKIFSRRPEKENPDVTRAPTRAELMLMSNFTDKMIVDLATTLREIEIEISSHGKISSPGQSETRSLTGVEMISTELRFFISTQAVVMHICLPCEMIKSVRHKLAEPPPKSINAADAVWMNQITQVVSAITVPVRGVIDQFPLTIQRLMNLARDDVLPLCVMDIELIMLTTSGGPLCKCGLEHDGKKYLLRPLAEEPSRKLWRGSVRMNQHLNKTGAQSEDHYMSETNDDNGLNNREKAGQINGVDKTDIVMSIPITVQVILGTATLPVAALMRLGRNSVIELDQRVGDPVEILANGCLIAKGEIMVLDEDRSRYGVSLMEVVPAATRGSIA